MKHTFQIGGKILSTDQPIIMGVLNVTPDSFYDGGSNMRIGDAMQNVAQMIEQGADIIDIGGYSSRPGAKDISEEEELSRIQPLVEEIGKSYPNAILSIDTFRSGIVNHLSEKNAFIINDISGFSTDDHMLNAIKTTGFPYILMHMKGNPQNMQKNPQYQDVAFEILDFMAQKLFQLNAAGVNQVIVDPGFGFGKSIDDNYILLDKLNVLSILDCPILVGLSRKSMIYKLLDIQPKEALPATAALNLLALQNGARILRVHDVKEAVETRKLWFQLNKARIED